MNKPQPFVFTVRLNFLFNEAADGVAHHALLVTQEPVDVEEVPGVNGAGRHGIGHGARLPCIV